MKTAKTPEDAWKIQETYGDDPHGWIQWKGTDVCMDVHCKCGKSFHIDAAFAYNVKCPYCSQVYCCNGHIELIALEEEPENCVVSGEKDILDMVGDTVTDEFIEMMEGQKDNVDWLTKLVANKQLPLGIDIEDERIKKIIEICQKKIDLQEGKI